MTFRQDIQKLWHRLTGKAQSSPVEVIPQRFRQIFRDHGIEASQIPYFSPQVSLKSLGTSQSLLEAMTPQILQETAHLFAVRLEWLEGIGDEIYETQSCYQQPERFFKFISKLQARAGDNFPRCPLRVLASTKKLDYRNSSQQLLVPVLVETIGKLGDEEILRFHIFGDGWNWGYPPTRIQLKAMVRVLFETLHAPVPFFEIPRTELQAIMEGRKVPRQYLISGLVTNPSLEDYALGGSVGGIAKEVDEFPAVLKYIEDHQLEGLISKRPGNKLDAENLAEPSEPANSPTNTVNDNARKAANAKHAAMNAIKERFILFYKTNGSDYISKVACARKFFNDLPGKEKFLFATAEAAEKTLTEALRAHLKGPPSVQ